ncbi:MAG TPA: sulfatase-like hydrolase/transferase [Actinomycetota bacterium]|nr:sulfatase-like hydrolase/transferase [Actinomycetota bacterium]
MPPAPARSRRRRPTHDRPIRRAALGLAAIAVSVLIPVVRAPQPAAAATVAPNVLILLSDDQAMGTLGAMPELMRHVAAPGVTFSRGYISDPLCCPSRASILTGLYATHTGVFTNGEGSMNTQHGGTEAFEDNGNEDRTIATTLQAAGYQTALFGKFLNGYETYSIDHPGPSGPYFRPDGWDVWRAFYGDNGAYLNYDLLRYDVGTEPRLVHYGLQNRKGATDISTTVLGQQLRFWLGHRDASVPFFAYYAPYSPHGPSSYDARDASKFSDLPPFTSPALNESPNAKSDMPTYVRNVNLTALQLKNTQTARIRQFRSLASFDRQIGQVMTYLERTPDPRTGLPAIQSTIVLYLSDNGVMWGEHDLRGKSVPYERSTHVPMFLRDDAAPSSTGYIPGSTSRRLVANIDVAPTIYQLTGVAPPGPLDGVSMLQGHDDGVMLASLAQTPTSAPSFCGVVLPSGWKYVVYVPLAGQIEAPFEDELYRIPDDPAELRNLVDAVDDPAAMAAESRAKALLQATTGGDHWCELPGVPESWYDAWA